MDKGQSRKSFVVFEGPHSHGLFGRKWVLYIQKSEPHVNSKQILHVMLYFLQGK